MNKINRNAYKGERILLAAYQRYWFRGDLLQCLSSSRDLTDLMDTSGDDLWLEFYKKGFSFLFVDKTTHTAFLEKLDVDNHPDWVKLTPIFNQQSTLLVYRIHFADPPKGVEPMTCEKQPFSTVWKVVSP